MSADSRSALPGSSHPVITIGAIAVGSIFAGQVALFLAARDTWASATTAYLWSVAGVAAGALLGFLFGVPKVLQDDTTKIGGYRQLVNTNLDQISDWLTKVVVGLSLVNAKNITTYLENTAAILATALGHRSTDQALAMAVLVYFPVVGFMSVYILTRLYLSPAFSENDQALQRAQQLLVEAHGAATPAEAQALLDRISSTIAPRTGREAQPVAPKTGAPEGAPKSGDAEDGGITPLAHDEDHIDGCGVSIAHVTADQDLPAAEGGVQR